LPAVVGVPVIVLPLTARPAGRPVADHVWLHPIIGGPLGNHVEAYTTTSVGVNPSTIDWTNSWMPPGRGG